MKSYEIGLKEISLNKGEIYLALGYRDVEPDPRVVEFLEQEIENITAFCHPRFGYHIAKVDEILTNSVKVEGATIITGGVITPYFHQAQSLAVFVATAGVEFDEYLHKEVKQSGDIFREFIVDAIGSEIAEATGRVLIKYLADEAMQEGWNISNSYSPGYCGWNVREQKQLFSLLCEKPCGITLSDSCLMSPIKSISGLIALGENVKKMPYGCEICNKQDCYKKRL